MRWSRSGRQMRMDATNHPGDQGPAPWTHLSGAGRSGTNEEGSYWFETIKPAPVPFNRERMQAPHICVSCSLAECSTT